MHLEVFFLYCDRSGVWHWVQMGSEPVQIFGRAVLSWERERVSSWVNGRRPTSLHISIAGCAVRVLSFALVHRARPTAMLSGCDWVSRLLNVHCSPTWQHLQLQLQIMNYKWLTTNTFRSKVSWHLQTPIDESRPWKYDILLKYPLKLQDVLRLYSVQRSSTTSVYNWGQRKYHESRLHNVRCVVASLRVWLAYAHHPSVCPD